MADLSTNATRILTYLHRNTPAPTHIAAAERDLGLSRFEIVRALEELARAERITQEGDVIRLKVASNPFGYRGRITDAAHFFDREELLRQIFEELGKGVNLSLVGPSQVGKSSVLAMVCAQGPGQLDLPASAFVYLSLEQVDDEDDFYEALCLELGIPVSRGGKLARALRGKRYILCLDEMERMTWDEFGFTVRVRTHLRGLADGMDAPLKLVTASRSSLRELFPDAPGMTSPLAGICRQLDVGPFAPDVARDFIAARLTGTGVNFTAGEVAALLRESERHPAKLQALAADLYREKTQEM
jgi:hypothetical protein